MKLTDCLVILLVALVLQVQIVDPAAAATIDLPAPGSYAVFSRDADSAVWQLQTIQRGLKGTLVTNVHQYTELATGLNVWRNGKWQPSAEDIEISPDGTTAAATNGEHQVYFPGDVYSGNIRLVTPDGQTLVSQPLGLAYFDGSNSVLLAAVTNSTGAILPTGNQVIYTNAFAGLNADLIYTYTKAGVEQDVVIRAQLPDPASLGLNPLTTRLQMLTEFVTAPQPNVIATTVQTDSGNLEDDSLSFGSMGMGQGRAFLIGASSPSVGVDKRWVVIQGRQFLVEEVPVVSIASQIDTLPPFVAKTGAQTTKYIVSKNLNLPPQRLAQTSPRTTFLAQAKSPGQGLVLDYNLSLKGDLTNIVFQGDTTYYLSGTVHLWGTNNLIEGGAVLKYTNNAALLVTRQSTTPAIQFQTSAYRPAIFTAWNDNTVGDTISGATGTPTYCANPALSLVAPSFTPTIANFRIAYAQSAISLAGVSPTVVHGQIVNCQTGIFVNGAGGNIENVLFANVVNDFSYSGGGSLTVQSATFNGSSNLESGGASLGLAFTNCIFANVTNLYTGTPSGFGGDHNGFYLTPAFGTATNGTTTCPFQSVGAGNYYLTNGCAFANAGTTNIDPVLLADLQTRTTYPPAFVYTNVSQSGTWVPQVQRDTNAAPALGYHYAPIDYAVSGVTVNGTLTLTNGVAVASFQSVTEGGTCAPGFLVNSGEWLSSAGTALVHNQICHYAAVQEQPIQWGVNAFNRAVTVVAWSGASPAVLYARFTDFAGLAGLGTSAGFAANEQSGAEIGGGDPMEFNLRDCRVGPGWLTCYTDQVTNENICINNLFDRGGIDISDFDGDSPVTMQNNLFHNGYVNFDNQLQTYTWTVENNFFDNATLSPGSGGLSQDHNGYWNTTQLTPTNGNDVVLTSFAYASGPLGDFYQLSTNLLNVGSTNAAAVGLYHYIVTTNETVEGTSTVSIGFHYVATDTNGVPLDSNSNGVPDYIEDANGDGMVDNGEDNWAVAILSQPVSQIVPPGTNVTFTATGAGLYGVTYQWQLTNMNLSGATNATLSLTNVQLGQTGAYDVVVTGNGGMGSVVSSNAYLYLLTPPVIASQTLPTNPVCIYGNVLSFSVTATASGQTNVFPFFYQWQCGGTNIPGATTNAYSFTVDDNSSGIYSVIVTNAAGSTSANWQVTVTNAINVTNDLLLIYNTNSADSTTVLNYYLAHRPMVSGANVLGIGCTNNEITTRVDFTNQILIPYLNWLANNPAKRLQYVILFLDIPSRVEDSGGTWPSVQYQLHTDMPGGLPYITSINMNGAGGTNDCIAYINKLATVGVLISSNSPVLSASANAYGNTNYILDNVNNLGYDESIVSNAINGLVAAGVQANCISYLYGYENPFSLPHLTNAVNVAGYICWGGHSSLGGSYPLDKVQWSGNSGWWIIRTEESYNGRRGGQFLMWFSSNAFGGTTYSNTPVAGVTYVEEPGAEATDNEKYFGLWASGKNFGICAWSSITMTGYIPAFQMVGDPFVAR